MKLNNVSVYFVTSKLNEKSESAFAIMMNAQNYNCIKVSVTINPKLNWIHLKNPYPGGGEGGRPPPECFSLLELGKEGSDHLRGIPDFICYKKGEFFLAEVKSTGSRISLVQLEWYLNHPQFDIRLYFINV
jgi:hypothetical protein